MNASLPLALFCAVFAIPAVVSIIGHAERIGCTVSGDTMAKEDHVQGICNTLRALVILGVLVLFQVMIS